MENFDPHKSSNIPESLKLKHTQGNLFVDTNTGEKFFLKEGTSSKNKTEYFISLLTKGIFHTSDFLKYGDSYYSKEINLEGTEPGKVGEEGAETFLLRVVLGDSDRGDIQNNNLEKDQQGRFAHYDYAQAFGRGYKGHSDKWYKDLLNDSSSADRILTEYMDDYKFSKDLKQNFLQQLKEKIFALKNTAEDENFLETIIKKSEIDSNGSMPIDIIRAARATNKDVSNSGLSAHLKEYLTSRLSAIETAITKILE